MKYMVMECHPGYAVVLDENGQFTKVANMRYEVGQTVTEVVEMAMPQSTPIRKKNRKWLYSLTAAAACLLLLLVPSLAKPSMPYASVYMTINPEVRIDVDRNDMVVGLEGVNDDGVALIEGYRYQRKDLDLVVDELVDRAIEMGFLHEGGTITLALDADDNVWVVTHSGSLDTQLHDYLTDKISVTIAVTEKNSDLVTIPVEEDDEDDADDDDADDDDDESDDLDEAPDEENDRDDDDDDDRDNEDDLDDAREPDDSDEAEWNDDPDENEPDDDDDDDDADDDNDDDIDDDNEEDNEEEDKDK